MHIVVIAHNDGISECAIRYSLEMENKWSETLFTNELLCQKAQQADRRTREEKKRIVHERKSGAAASASGDSLNSNNKWILHKLP